MIEVIIVPLGIIRELIEKKEILLKFNRPEVTVKDLIDVLDKKYSISLRDEMKKYNVSIMVNGYEVEFLRGFNTKLHNRDRVSFIPPVAGGTQYQFFRKRARYAGFCHKSLIEIIEY